MRITNSKQQRLENVQKQCNQIAQSFARLSLELGELVHDDSDDEDSTSSDSQKKLQQSIAAQIDIAAKGKEDIDLATKKTIEERERKKRSLTTRRSETTSQIGPYNIGTELEIANNYLGLRGTRGRVIHSGVKYTIIEDKNGTPHKRIHGNLKPLR